MIDTSFTRNLQMRSVVHYPGMILPYYITLQTFACILVYDLPFNYTISINYPIFSGKILITGMDMIRMRQRFHCAQLTMQIFSIRICQQLISILAVIAETIIKVVIYYARSSTERYLPVIIGKEIKPVMMVMLHYRQVRMQHHPMYEIGELAQTPPMPLDGIPCAMVSPSL